MAKKTQKDNGWINKGRISHQEPKAPKEDFGYKNKDPLDNPNEAHEQSKIATDGMKKVIKQLKKITIKEKHALPAHAIQRQLVKTLHADENALQETGRLQNLLKEDERIRKKIRLQAPIHQAIMQFSRALLKIEKMHHNNLKSDKSLGFHTYQLTQNYLTGKIQLAILLKELTNISTKTKKLLLDCYLENN